MIPARFALLISVDATVSHANDVDSHSSNSLRIHTVPRAHLVGIAGAGMRSLADVLSAAGWQISGSDLDASSLAGCAWNIRTGHDARSVSPDFDVVVRSDA